MIKKMRVIYSFSLKLFLFIIICFQFHGCSVPKVLNTESDIRKWLKLSDINELESMNDDDYVIRIWSNNQCTHIQSHFNHIIEIYKKGDDISVRKIYYGYKVLLRVHKCRIIKRHNEIIKYKKPSCIHGVQKMVYDFDVFNIPDQKDIKDYKKIFVADGVYYVIEIKKGKKYWTLTYNNPERETYPESKRVVEFINNVHSFCSR